MAVVLPAPCLSQKTSYYGEALKTFSGLDRATSNTCIESSGQKEVDSFVPSCSGMIPPHDVLQAHLAAPSTTPIHAEGHERKSGTSTTPNHAEGRARTLEIVKSPQFLHTTPIFAEGVIFAGWVRFGPTAPP